MPLQNRRGIEWPVGFVATEEPLKGTLQPTADPIGITLSVFGIPAGGPMTATGRGEPLRHERADATLRTPLGGLGSWKMEKLSLLRAAGTVHSDPRAAWPPEKSRR